MLLHCCRVVKCPQLDGETVVLKSQLNHAYVGGPGAPQLQQVLQQLKRQGSGRQSESGDAQSSDRARSSEARGAKPRQEECSHCGRYGHGYASVALQLPCVARVRSKHCETTCAEPACLSAVCCRRLAACPELATVPEGTRARITQAYDWRNYGLARSLWRDWQRQQWQRRLEDPEQARAGPRQEAAGEGSGDAHGGWDGPESISAQGAYFENHR